MPRWSDSSSTSFARGVNGIWPVAATFALADHGSDRARTSLDRELERLEHARREPLLLAQQPEQDVLGADVVVPERARLVLREDDHLPRTLGEALEHERTLRQVTDCY